MAISRIFIINRGEIALRIIRTCKVLGIETILAVSEADQDSLPARIADKAVLIGKAPATKSYLNIPTIISTAVSEG
ncbi:MAG: acetyl-CoA carboxylase biotin carboxylase subunit [Neobacillus sp.]|nr:acetyl-CoA carboxylase biotin carboxylase subunit [Neobacillus sp.]